MRVERIMVCMQRSGGVTAVLPIVPARAPEHLALRAKAAAGVAAALRRHGRGSGQQQAGGQ